jgi:hypothetical protein
MGTNWESVNPLSQQERVGVREISSRLQADLRMLAGGFHPLAGEG